MSDEHVKKEMKWFLSPVVAGEEDNLLRFKVNHFQWIFKITSWKIIKGNFKTFYPPKL